MKKNNILNLGKLVLLFIGFVALIACSKDDSPEITPEPTPDKNQPVATAKVKFEATGETDSFEAFSEKEFSEKLKASEIPAQLKDGELNLLFVSGFDAGGDQAGLMFVLFDVDGAGSYAIRGAGVEEGNASLYIPNGGSELASDLYGTAITDIDGNTFEGSGTVKITSLTEKLVEGTFEVSLYNSNVEKVTFTDGKFSASLVRK